MRIYVSGPMTGIEDWNFPAFNAAEKLLVEANYTVENPAAKGLVEGWTWEQYLAFDLVQLLECDGVALLDGWEDSKGARLEVHFAERLGLPVLALHDWLHNA